MNLTDIKNQTILLRVNYDLPDLKSYSRILDSFGTIEILLKNSNKVVLLSHWGRPAGQNDQNLSLKKILPAIKKCLKESDSNLLQKAKVEFIDQYESKSLTETKIKLSNSNIILLENTRFEPREQSKDTYERESLAQIYADYGQILVNDAFAVSHRQESTNTELMSLLPSLFGLAYENEIRHLDKIKHTIDRPFALVLGGFKLETKLELLQKLLPQTDIVILGGALCFTFLQVKAELENNQKLLKEINGAPIQTEFLAAAKELYQLYSEKIIMPIDFVFDKKVPADIGPKTIKLFEANLKGIKTLFWNGPMGKYENKKFRKGTLKLGRVIAILDKCFKVIGGGDTYSSLPEETLQEFDFVSMGGGATLDYLTR